MAEMLCSEGVQVIDDRVQDFKKVYWDPAIRIGALISPAL